MSQLPEKNPQKKKFRKAKMILLLVIKHYRKHIQMLKLHLSFDKSIVNATIMNTVTLDTMNELFDPILEPKGVLNISRRTSELNSLYSTVEAQIGSSVQEDENGEVVQDCILKNMATKLDEVQSATTVLIHEFSKLTATVKSLVLAMTGEKIPDINGLFPIDKMEDLEEIIRLSQSSEDFALNLNIYLKYLKSPSTKEISTAFRELVSDNFLEKYNWDGLKQQQALRKIKFFNSTLFEAWRTPEFTKDIYIDAVQSEIRKSHYRQAQRNNDAKRQRTSSVSNEII